VSAPPRSAHSSESLVPSSESALNSGLGTRNQELSPKVGILAMQGDFAEHAAVLRRLGAVPLEVRLPADLDGLHGLIIPGGESTTIGKVMAEWGLLQPLRQAIEAGLPVWGTCAGAILLAREVRDALPDQPLLRVMDITVRRNAFGRQLQSFETRLTAPALGAEPIPAVFIRAPKIEDVGPDVEVMASLPDGSIVAARQGHLLVTAFHPELTPDTRFHRYFLYFLQRPQARVGVAAP
jgi:5'-phosphate synthase pdxT subunit